MAYENNGGAASNNQNNSAAKIAELAVAAQGVPVLMPVANGRQFILHPPGYVAKEVPQLPQDIVPPIPQYTSQIVNLQNEMSLTAYVNRFKNSDTVIFADIEQNSITAIIDYHHEAVKQDEAANAVSKGIGSVAPALRAHQAILRLPFSIEWNEWIEHDECHMSQLDFVNFLEDNTPDIKSLAEGQPDGAGLLELCRDLEGTRNVKFGASVRAGSVDNIDFVRESGAQTKGKLELPKELGLSIPVYFGDEEIEMVALLRRNISSDGALTLWYKLLRPENVRQNRFQEIVQRIETDTHGLTTVYGSASSR